MTDISTFTKTENFPEIVALVLRKVVKLILSNTYLSVIAFAIER